MQSYKSVHLYLDCDTTGQKCIQKALEIDKQKSISFKLADWKKPITVPAEKPVIVKDSTIYTLKSDTTKWTITIFPEFCNDGMSDYLYQYKVNVNYNGVKYKGCGVVLSK